MPVMKEALFRQLIAAGLALLTLALTRFSLGGFIFLWAVWILPIEAQHLIRNIIHNYRIRQAHEESPHTLPSNR
jgi:hypothetical protein